MIKWKVCWIKGVQVRVLDFHGNLDWPDSKLKLSALKYNFQFFNVLPWKTTILTTWRNGAVFCILAYPKIWGSSYVIVLIIRFDGAPGLGTRNVAVVPSAWVVSLVSQDKWELAWQTVFGWISIRCLTTWFLTSSCFCIIKKLEWLKSNLGQGWSIEYISNKTF